jgi:hypothetical protein
MTMGKMYFYETTRIEKMRDWVFAESREEADRKAKWWSKRVVSCPAMETTISDVSYLGEGDEYWRIHCKDLERLSESFREKTKTTSRRRNVKCLENT